MDKIKDYDGKLSPKDTYSPNEIETLRRERNCVPDVTSRTIMQKVVPECGLEEYINPDTIKKPWLREGAVGGFVAKAEDAAPFTNSMSETYESMRLDYCTSPYTDAEQNLYIVRFLTDESDIVKYEIPYSPEFKGDMTASNPNQQQIPNRTNGNTPPCTENGFTGSSQYLIPETYYERSKIEEGAIFKIDNMGNESLVAIFDGSKFISVNSK